MPKPAAATVAIRSINVRWCRDVVMLCLWPLERPGPLWITVYASPPGRGPLGKFQLYSNRCAEPAAFLSALPDGEGHPSKA
jgi:hypothetical protein